MDLNVRGRAAQITGVSMRRVNGRIRLSSTSLFLATAFWCAGAYAQMLVHFDLPAQPLARSLEAIGTATKTDVGFSASQVAGLLAPQLKADLTVDGALTRVLVGTGLRPKHLDDHTIVIAAMESSSLDYGSPKSDPSQASTPGRQPSTSVRTVNLGDNSSALRLAQANAADGNKATDSEHKESQNSDSQLEQVVVTGSHIRGTAPVGAPVFTLDSEDISRSGYTTTEQLIQALPQSFRGGAAGASADANFSGGANNGFNGAFGSGVNLRGLGNTATLVLVNGHRVASSGGGYFTDISTIPLSAIDHVDILTDGASAIYGSDAIAGVVNLVLKKQSQGVEVGARYDAARGFSTDGGNLQLGREWATGGATLDGDFSHQSILDASERPFTSTVGTPTSILPAYHQTALSAASHQSIGDQFEVHGDAQYTEKEVTDFISTGVPTVSQHPKVDRWSGSVGVSYQISDTWSLHYDASGGVGVENLTIDESGALSEFSFIDKETSRFSDQNVAASGNLFSLRAGPIKLALGVSYRTEEFSTDERLTQLGIQDNIAVHRTVKSGYGEVFVPIVNELNAFSGISKLSLSAAVRRDDYSDFGSTTNPKYGVSWFPINALEIRGAYSTSFRAPAAGVELVNSKIGTSSVSVFSLNGPDNGPPVPVVFLGGARPNLGPETARNLTAGMDFKPTFVPGLQVTFNYYYITYKNQLATPPYSLNALNTPSLASVITRYPSSRALQAVVNSAIQGGAFYSDSTAGAFGQNPLANAVYLYDGRIENIAATKTSGVDVGARYQLVFGTDRVDTRVDATYIDKFAVFVTPNSPLLSGVNSVGDPARLRIRGQSTWTHNSLSASIAANYVGSYPDTSAQVFRDVGSFTTFDIATRYEMPHGIAATFAVANVLNRLPPYVVSGALNFPGSHYDPANANPIGRAFALGLSKRW
jgi:iron complex outermembrane receptor protein